MVYRLLKHKKKTGSAINAPPVRVLVIMQLFNCLKIDIIFFV